jgi:RNA polymerase sigma-70 factor (ECF subfamily)
MAQDVAATGDDWTTLIEAAHRGDDAALGEICERLRDYLLLTAGQGLGSELRPKVGASDIVQQSLLEAQQGFHRFSGASRDDLRAWLLKILEHNLIDSARRYRRTQQRDYSREVSIDEGDKQREIPGPQKTGSSEYCRRETGEQLLRAIEELPQRQQQIIELRHRHGLGYAEIAKQLHVSEEAARKIWSRAVESLRQKLSQKDDLPSVQSD